MKSLRAKILGSFSLILGLLLILSAYSFIQMSNFKNQVDEALGNKLTELVYWQELNYSMANRLATIRGYLLTGNEQYYKDFESMTTESIVSQDKLLELDISDNEKTIFEKTARWNQEANRIFELYIVNPDTALQHAGSVRDLSDEITTDFQAATNTSREDMRVLKDEIIKLGNTIMIITVFISIVAILIGVIVAVILANKITKPIIEVVRRVKKIEMGDLTGERIVLKSKDEVGQLAEAMNNMISSLRLLVGDVLENANNLAASSQEISASTEQIASGSQLQANNAGLASEMVKEMTNAIHQVSLNAEETSNATEHMVQSAENGNGVLHDTLKGMTEISNKISELSSKSVQIGEIVEVIDDIAEQTNLLALNAAIEAARAGEAGKGFAVVADEIRRLAERSSKATKEISELIQSIQSNTDQSVQAVSIGNEKANNAGIAFEEIINLVKISASKVAEIAAASEEQNAQSQEVLQSVENIASVSQETAAGVQETAATAADLAKMAEGLSRLAAKFKV